jgi:hypothetical protein
MIGKHYSCTCCTNSYIGEVNTQHTGCDLCGSSLKRIEISDPKIFEILKSNLKKMPIPERLLDEQQSYGID